MKKTSIILILCLLVVLIVAPAVFAADDSSETPDPTPTPARTPRPSPPPPPPPSPPPVPLWVNGSSTHVRYSMDDLSFTCPVPITRVYIEYEGYEQLTDPDAFSISSDGLTVTVFAKYLNQLMPDAFYTITADVTENIAQATFSIADCPLLVPETALATGSEEPLRFTAPQDGYYTFSYENGGTNGELQILDPGTDSWQTNPSVMGRRFAEGETIYLRPVYDQAAEGLLSVLVQQVTPSAHGEIEFPAELVLLQDEACRGLMIDDVVFGDKIQIIGSKAFADCPNLRRVEIPVANVNIEDDAFADSSNVILYAPTGGSVEQYAENHHIMFEAMLA